MVTVAAFCWMQWYTLLVSVIMVEKKLTSLFLFLFFIHLPFYIMQCFILLSFDILFYVVAFCLLKFKLAALANESFL